MRRRTQILVAVVAVVVLVAGVGAFLVLTAPSSPGTSAGTPGAATCPTVPAGSEGGNWTTYHGGNDRSGVVPAGPVTTARSGWPSPVTVDGQVYAQPLVCGNAVYVATEDDSVYALNASDGAVIWHTHLGTPMPGSSLPCGDIDPSGITGTPVIDAATGVLYAVAFATPGNHTLYGLSVLTGKVVSSTDVDPSGANPLVEQQRGALTLANGYVYVVYGGLDGDCGAYHGWVVGAPVGAAGGLVAYQVPTHREGGIWGTAGTAVAPDGDLYVATGNGDSNTVFDHGDAVIELSPTLTELGYFAPSNWAQLNADDTDLGSVAPTYLPNGDVFQIGKAGEGYLLAGGDLGGIGGGVANASVCAGAYGATARVGLSILVPCTDGVVDVVATASNLSVAWSTSEFDAGSPIVTGDVVWSVDIDSAQLLGFGLANGTEMFSFSLGAADHFISPAAEPGRLFVGGGAEVYGFDWS